MSQQTYLQYGKANILIDGQWGSTGKGKLAGWLCQNAMVNIVVGDNMPNAGHTYVHSDGQKIIFKVLPIGALFAVNYTYLGPQAVFSLERLKEEMDVLRRFRSQTSRSEPTVCIHPHASVLTEADTKTEQQSLNTIASTMQGSAVSVIQKMMRNPDSTCLAKHHIQEIKNLDVVVQDMTSSNMRAINTQKVVLLEGSQGFDLSLNHGECWPYVTSRDCLPGRMMDNAGIPLKYLGEIIGSIRTYPIRVGNTEGGYSGGYYEDQKEISWEDISQWTGMEVCERTTVTKRIRRVFTFSEIQYMKFLRMVEPTVIFINFVNYLSEQNVKEAFLENIMNKARLFGVNRFLFGHGEKLEEMTSITY